MNFVTNILSTSPLVVFWKGARMEAFSTWESENVSFGTGDRVRCLFVKEVQQVFVLERIST